MIWFANLDPSNLSLNIDTTLINNGTQDDQLINLAIMKCALGEVDVLKYILPLISKKENQIRCAYLCSIIWHEQRHFIDLVLLNYGNYVFRQFANCYIYTPNIIQEIWSKENQEIAFPISIYSDPIRRFQLKQKELSPKLKPLLTDLKEREKAIITHREFIGNGVKELGGYAQLEAMGSIFQIGAIENFIPEYIRPLSRIIAESDPKDKKYSWYLQFQEILKLPIFQNTKDDRKVARTGLVPILFYATLSTRHWNGDLSDTQIIGQKKNYFTPGERFNYLLEYLQNKPSIFEPYDFQEVWTKVNAIVKQLFGRTIVEEIDNDIQSLERSLKNRGVFRDDENNSVSIILIEHLNLRKKLFKILRDEPEKILHPDSYSTQTLKNVLPIPILTFPSGAESHIFEDSDWEGLNSAIFQAKNKKDRRFYWSALPKNWATNNKISLKKINDWRQIFLFNTPLVKAMLKGRNHRLSIGPEFLVMEEDLKTAGISVVYEPEFEFPQNLYMPASSFYEMKGTEKGICDWCGKNLMKPEGYIISPWVFRKNHHIERITIQRLGNNIEAERKAAIDWTAWMFCKDCKDEFKRVELI